VNTDNHYFATCSKGVEDLLLAELQAIGVEDTKIHTGGVAFTGELKLAYKACLWSRIASRILFKLSSFNIDNDENLYQQVYAIDWSQHFDVDNTLAIDCFSSHSSVNNSHFATLRIKDAVVDQFTKNVDSRPSIDRESPEIRINAYLSDKQCMLYLDLSGEALHKRAYRQAAGSAPLLETLAASMLYRAKWQSFYEQGLPLYDPMCGSGTVLIEAAMMAANIAPGLLRASFGFFHWKAFSQPDWDELIQQAEQEKQQGLNNKIIIRGSDSDEVLVGIARKNIEAAGLSSLIKVTLQDATKNLAPPVNTAGLLVTNPPYGKRIGQIQILRTLYHRFGQQLKANFNDWTAVIITSEPELARSIGLRSFHKNTLFNGALKSVLYQYHINSKPEIDDDESTEKGASSQAASEHAAMFINRLKKNYKHLKKWARKNNISCYRVYDADIPQYAVAIDIYAHWVHVQEYQAPKTVDKNKAFQRINDVIDVVADTLETKQDYVVLKTRKKQGGSAQYEKLDKKNHRSIVKENGLKFYINMYDYIDTGLFLDHRKTREIIKQLAPGRSFLNLFAYTGSVTVYAAAGGAKTTTTVDMSNTYLDWAQDNLSLNDFVGDKHHFERDDCLVWLDNAVKEKKKYQLIFIDPPTFSNSKKMTTALDINRDYAKLLNNCVELLSDDGVILFSTNAKGFKLDESLLHDCFIKDITSITTSEDFRRKPLHKCWCLAKQQDYLRLKEALLVINQAGTLVRCGLLAVTSSV